MIYVIGEKNSRQTIQLIEKALEISEQLPHQTVTLFNIDTAKITLSDGISEYFKNRNADYILLPSTPLFREIAAEMTVKMSAALLTDCISLSVDKGILKGIRPSLDGKSFSHYTFPDNQTAVIVVRDTDVTEPRRDWIQQITIIAFPGNTISENDSPVSCSSVNGAPVNSTSDNTAQKYTEKCTKHKSAASGETVFVKRIIHPDSAKDIKDAQLIFAGGRGLMNEQSFKELRKLADIFDASIGASRPVVDCGWAEPSEQVGQTGSFVHPKVYLAFGISGAIQHLAGMKNSQCIIAVNNNRNSPIFQYCDYGICADANSIIRNLLHILQADNNVPIHPA